MKTRITRTISAAAATAALATTGGAPAATAASSPDPFYEYTGSAPLSSYAPGTVLKKRTLQYHVVGLPNLSKVTQIVYRTTDAAGRPEAGVTSVVNPVGKFDHRRVVSYQSAYDSLNPEDGPSRAIAGRVSFGGAFANAEPALIAPFLLKGYSVILPDTEGPKADFAAGVGYGQVTLDSLRAVSNASAETGVDSDASVALVGYSGGAIASNWAAVLAPSYAPEVNKRLVGVAEGGLFVDPAHNFKYIDGSLGWAGVGEMAIIGTARVYGLDYSAYLNDYGKQLLKKLDKASITNVLYQYPGLKWSQLAKPEYADPETVPPFREAVQRANLGDAPNPTIPVFLGQGTGGSATGTPGDKPGIGPGDGVMVAGDVRTLARNYCSSGVPVQYQQYEGIGHIASLAPWTPVSTAWVEDRFRGIKAPSNCNSIPAGNKISPAIN